MRFLIACLFLLALSACGAGSEFGLNPQGDAGLTNVRADFDEATGQLVGFRWIDGKEKGNVSIKADLKAGTFEYAATEVAAFEAFKSRADVEIYVAQQWPSLAPDIKDGVVGLIQALIGVP